MPNIPPPYAPAPDAHVISWVPNATQDGTVDLPGLEDFQKDRLAYGVFNRFYTGLRPMFYDVAHNVDDTMPVFDLTKDEAKFPGDPFFPDSDPKGMTICAVNKNFGINQIVSEILRRGFALQLGTDNAQGHTTDGQFVTYPLVNVLTYFFTEEGIGFDPSAHDQFQNFDFFSRDEVPQIDTLANAPDGFNLGSQALVAKLHSVSKAINVIRKLEGRDQIDFTYFPYTGKSADDGADMVTMLGNIVREFREALDTDTVYAFLDGSFYNANFPYPHNGHLNCNEPIASYSEPLFEGGVPQFEFLNADGNPIIVPCIRTTATPDAKVPDLCARTGQYTGLNKLFQMANYGGSFRLVGTTYPYKQDNFVVGGVVPPGGPFFGGDPTAQNPFGWADALNNPAALGLVPFPTPDHPLFHGFGNGPRVLGWDSCASTPFPFSQIVRDTFGYTDFPVFHGGTGFGLMWRTPHRRAGQVGMAGWNFLDFPCQTAPQWSNFNGHGACYGPWVVTWSYQRFGYIINRCSNFVPFAGIPDSGYPQFTCTLTNTIYGPNPGPHVYHCNDISGLTYLCVTGDLQFTPITQQLGPCGGFSDEPFQLSTGRYCGLTIPSPVYGTFTRIIVPGSQIIFGAPEPVQECKAMYGIFHHHRAYMRFKAPLCVPAIDSAKLFFFANWDSRTTAAVTVKAIKVPDLGSPLSGRNDMCTPNSGDYWQAADDEGSSLGSIEIDQPSNLDPLEYMIDVTGDFPINKSDTFYNLTYALVSEEEYQASKAPESHPAPAPPDAAKIASLDYLASGFFPPIDGGVFGNFNHLGQTWTDANPIYIADTISFERRFDRIIQTYPAGKDYNWLPMKNGLHRTRLEIKVSAS